jgi:hypothetical protein
MGTAVSIGIAAASVQANAATRIVTFSNDDNGATCNAVSCSLRAAINVAQNDDVIQFSPSLSYPLTIRLEAPLTISAKKLRIEHSNRGAVTLDARPASSNPYRFRVLELINGADVTITGLNLVQGRAYASAGSSGATPGAAGIPGAIGQGGCIWVGAGTYLTLQSVVVRDCEAHGGAGGSGATGNVGAAGRTGRFQQSGSTGERGQAGGRGGNGGEAWGGGIFVDGSLLLLDSSVVHNLASGGNGGSGANGGRGGKGGNGGSGGGTGTGGDGGSGGDGGNGGASGEGGSAYGGGIRLGIGGMIHSVNSVIADNLTAGLRSGVPGGAGGSGGGGKYPGEESGPGSTGNGGAYARFGSASGGGLSAVGGSSSGILSFSSVVKNRVQKSVETPSIPAGATETGGGLGSTGTIELRNSIVASNMLGNGSLNNCVQPPLRSSGINFGDTYECGFGIVTSTPRITYVESGPVPLVRLDYSSPAIDAVSDCRILVSGIPSTLDIRGADRPQDGNGDGVALCDIGAYEVTAIAPM